MKYKHLFFDLDHTLWDFETNSSRSLSELYSQFNLSGLGVDDLDEFVAAYQRINDGCWAEYRAGRMSKDVLRTARFEKTLEEFGVYNSPVAAAFGLEYVRISPYKTGLLPGALDVLSALHGKYELHIITNGFEEVQHIKIKESKLENYFNEIITSEQAGCKKPDIRIFEFAAERTKALPAESIMIGDSLEADIVGARNAGFDQVYFNPKGEDHGEILTHEIKHLNELLAIL